MTKIQNQNTRYDAKYIMRKDLSAEADWADNTTGQVLLGEKNGPDNICDAGGSAGPAPGISAAGGPEGSDDDGRIFRATFEQAAVGIAHISLGGQFIRVNRRFSEIAGYSRTEMLALSLRIIIHPDDLDADYAQNRRLLAGEIGGYAVEKRCLKKNGSIVRIKLIMSLVRNRNGQPDYFIAVSEDVSAGKIAEKALIESRRRYKKLWDDAPVACHTLNSRGFVTRVNRTELGMLGYGAEEMVGRPIFDFFPPADREAAKRRFQQKIAGYLTPGSYDGAYLRKDGSVLRVSISDIVERNDGGEIAGIRSASIDITERLKLQKEIIEEKRHYKQVIDSIRDGICVLNANREIVSYNKSFAEKVNLPVTAIKGKKCHEVFRLYRHNVFKDYCARNCGESCLAARSLHTGKTHSMTEKSRDGDGRIHFHKILAFAGKPAAGGIAQTVIAVRDITLSKEAEDKIRRLSEFNQRIINSVPVSIVVLNKEGVIIASNELANRLLGAPGREMTGSKLTDTGEIRNNKDLSKMYADLLGEGKPFYYDNLAYVSGETGEKKYLNVIAVPLLDKRQWVEGAISMALDNTEAVKAREKIEDLNQNLEDKVRQRTKELEETNKKLSRILDAQSKFIGNASHELRTPLTVIQGNIELAMMEAKRNECPRFDPEVMETILGEVESMSHILTDLTMLTNIDAQNERIIFDKVDLGDIIGNVCRSLKVLARQKGIALERKKPGNGLKINGDETKLEKLVLNIARNAIKYTGAGGRVTVGAETDEAGKEIRVRVEDTGIGIPAEDLPHIFERFYRADKARSRSEGGSGLGLSIAKWIAEAHGGRIGAESVPGKGSVFTIHLPVTRPEGGEKKSRLYYYP